MYQKSIPPPLPHYIISSSIINIITITTIAMVTYGIARAVNLINV
jgi:hypothetical protein